MKQKGDANGNHRKTNQKIHSDTAAQGGGGAGTGDPLYDLAKAIARNDALRANVAQSQALQSAINQRAGLMTLGHGLGKGVGAALGGVFPSLGIGQYIVSDPTLAQQIASQPGIGVVHIRGISPTPYVEKEPEHEGVELGEVIAWRAWRYDSEYDVIKSMVAAEVWMPGQAVHGDTKGAHGLGIHAFKKPGETIKQYGYDRSTTIIIGRIDLWGEITEHEDGYRAEYGAPAAFEFIHPNNWWNRRKLKRLRAKYFGRQE